MLALLLQSVLLAIAVAGLAMRPRSPVSAASAVACAAVALLAGAAPLEAVREALAATLPLTCFLTAAIWLAAFAARAGLADRAAAALSRAARGRRAALYALLCALCALLTAAVSLDGAVVLMVPVLVALARRAPDLLRPLLLGTVAVANAFSLAVPQGNPTNLIVMERLGLGPAPFVAHMFVPGLLAALVCAGALAVAERRALRGTCATAAPAVAAPSARERLAAAGLGAAALAGAGAPWLGVPPWWGICGVAAAVYVAATLARSAPRPRVPSRLCLQAAALVVLVDPLAERLPAPVWGSLGPLVGLALLVALTASAINNLPASVVVSGVLGAHAPSAYAALAGLSVGALATPHGSVATLIALDRAGPRGAKLGRERYLPLWLPAAALATAVATVAAWLLAGGP